MLVVPRVRRRLQVGETVFRKRRLVFPEPAVAPLPDGLAICARQLAWRVQLADTATAAVLDPLFELAFVLRAVFFDGAVAKRMAGKPRTTARQTRGSFM